MFSLDDKLNVIKIHYENLEEELTNEGLMYIGDRAKTFVPSSIETISPLLNCFFQTNSDRFRNHLFLDAGLGDGRILALSSIIYNYKSVGVEYYPEIVKYARESFENDFDYLQGAPVEILQGDFLRNDVYKDNGYKFEDFGVIFNFKNNEFPLAFKIASKSPRDTVFALYSNNTDLSIYPDLEHIQTIVNEGDVAKEEPVSEDMLSKTALRVYRKR